MKIDVITRHAVPNYGSLLQTYATIKLFEHHNCDCDIINYVCNSETKKQYIKTILNSNQKWNKNIITRLAFYILQGFNYRISYNKFSRFREQLIGANITKEYNSIENLKQNLPSADYYCSGSDQIWGKIGTSNYDEAYFLDFLPQNKKCFSLSSSFGKESINDDLLCNLKKLTKKYSFITVREKSAFQILKKYGIKSKVTLDPTMLVEKSEWDLFKSKRIIKDKYILVYQLHNNKKFEKYLEVLQSKYNLKIYRICPSFHHVFRKGKPIYLPSIEDFLCYIRNASFVITDSFHCTVFSILFNKNFATFFANDTNTRIQSLLETFHLEKHIIDDLNNYNWIDDSIDWKKVNEEIEKLKKDNIQYLFDNIINDRTIEIVGNKCTGCRCCEQICPVNAISFIEDSEGFLIPKIDKEKCIECGKCLKRCPQLSNIINTSFEQETYACKNKNILIQKQSSSGGVFFEMAKYIVENDGFVCGAVFDHNKVIHYITNKFEDLHRFSGSKYVQSNVMDTYRQVEILLKQGKLILYSGTPCQIAGLKSFLQRGYSNLITVDLVCHGVPNQKLLDHYFSFLENQYKGKLEEYSFRSKEKNIWGTNSKAIFKTKKGKKIKYFRSSLDPYYKSFLDGITYRKCCYSCKYASKDRISDITIGDYWGIEKYHPEFKDVNGVSLVLINTSNGKAFFDLIKNNFYHIKSNFNYAKEQNHNLNNPVECPSNRNKVYMFLDELSFSDYSKKCLNFNKKIGDIIKDLLPQKFKNSIKNILKK